MVVVGVLDEQTLQCVWMVCALVTCEECVPDSPPD